MLRGIIWFILTQTERNKLYTHAHTHVRTHSWCLSKPTVQDPESPVPLHVRQPRRVPETFGERVAVDLQFGDLETHEKQHEKSFFVINSAVYSVFLSLLQPRHAASCSSAL